MLKVSWDKIVNWFHCYYGINRNLRFCRGIEIVFSDSKLEFISLRPINIQNLRGSCRIDIPFGQIDAVIQLLKDAKLEMAVQERQRLKTQDANH